MKRSVVTQKGIEYPYLKDSTSIIKRDFDKREYMLKHALPLVFEIVYEFVIPKEIVNILIDYVMDEELWDEIHKNLNFFYSKKYLDDMKWLRLALADVGVGSKRSSEIQLMYFGFQGWVEFRRTFDFPTPMSFGAAVEKRLKMIKTKEKHYYWSHHLKWENNQWKRKNLSNLERYWDVKIKAVSNLRHSVELVEWIHKACKFIIQEEKKPICQNTTWKFDDAWWMN